MEECVGIDQDILNEVIVPEWRGLIMRIISEKLREPVIKGCRGYISANGERKNTVPSLFL